MIVVLLILCVLVLGLTRSDSTSAGTVAPEVAMAPLPPDLSHPELEKSRTEVSGLRQEVADLGSQVRQQTMFSMAADDQVQGLRTQIAAAQKKILAADAERGAALGQVAELREELRRNEHHLAAVCEALSSAPSIPPERRAAMVVLSACPVAGAKQ